MLTLIFSLMMIMVFGKLLIFAVKAAWGIAKIFFTIFFLPLMLVGLFACGFVSIAVIVLAVIGIAAFAGVFA